MSDGALLQLLLTGDEPALIHLYDRYSGLVYSIAFRVLKNPESAEDVTQELFMRLWNQPEQVHAIGETLHGWMTTAARNRSIDAKRKKFPEPLGNLILRSPFNLGRQTEQRIMCETSLALLGSTERALIEMAFFQEMTHEEIATATGCPLGTIKSKIRRALGDLRYALVAPNRSSQDDERTPRRPPGLHGLDVARPSFVA